MLDYLTEAVDLRNPIPHHSAHALEIDINWISTTWVANAGGMVAAGFAIISICLAWERRKEVNEHNRIYAYVTMALRALDDAPLVSSCNAPMSRLASGSLNVSIS